MELWEATTAEQIKSGDLIRFPVAPYMHYHITWAGTQGDRLMRFSHLFGASFLVPRSTPLERRERES